MAINYQLYKMKRTGSAFDGKIYARAKYNEMYDLNKLAQHMAAHNTNFSRGQILAVLTDMVACTRELCLQSKKVKIENLGIFYPSLTSLPAEDTKKFNARLHIRAAHIRFLPSGENATKLYRKEATLREAGNYEIGLE